MKTVGKVFGWIGFAGLGLVLVFINNISVISFTGYAVPVVIFLLIFFVIVPIVLWIASLFIKNRSVNRIIYIVLAVLSVFYSLPLLVGGILLAIVMNKELAVQKYKETNGVYPWEEAGNTTVYPNYVYKTFGADQFSNINK